MCDNDENNRPFFEIKSIYKLAEFGPSLRKSFFVVVANHVSCIQRAGENKRKRQ